NVFAQTQSPEQNQPQNQSQPNISTNNSIYEGSTIDKIRTTNNIVIGIRPSSIPLSFYNANKVPIGYGVDICLLMVERLKQEYDLNNVNVSFKEVSGLTRIPEVVSGNVDLECGSTTTTES